MEEYIRLEEEKARKRGKVFNSKTAKYGKIWYDEDVHDLRSVEIEFPWKIGLQERIQRISIHSQNKTFKIYNLCTNLVNFADMAPLPPREKRHPFLRVQVLDFEGMPELMRDILYARMLMEYRDDDGVVVFTREEMESLSFARDSVLRLCHRSIAGRSQVPEKSGALISSGQFVAQLAKHSGLLTEERLHGLTVTAPALPIIDMIELVRLQICVELVDTWAWVPAGPARHEGDTRGVAKEALVAPEGGDEDEEIPQAVPPPPRTQGERIDGL
nr:hypothetical protein [Tanacetum cinerariifolium]